MSALVMLALLCAGGTESDSHSWFAGSVIMTNGQVIENEMAVIYSHEALLIKKKKGRHVIPAHKIVSFTYYDPNQRKQRFYKVISGQDRGFKCYKFYELLNEGKAEVLRRVQHNGHHVNNIKYSLSRTWVSDKLDENLATYDYYVYVDNEVIPICKFKKKILPRFMKKYKEPIKKLLKERRLNLESLGHRMIVISYYNLLYNKEVLNLSMNNDR